MVIFNTEYKSFEQGWQPGANTIAYFPFKGNDIDQVGNYVLSTSGVDATVSGVQGRRFTSTTSTTTMASAKTVLGWVCFNDWYASSGSQEGVFRIVSRISFMLNNVGNSNYPAFYLYYNGEYKSSKITINKGQWYLVAIAGGDGYINNTKYSVNSGTLPSADQAILLWSNAGKTIDVTFSELIVEDKTRTTDEITAYYNQTKSNYGL